jgi:hypothetical protein
VPSGAGPGRSRGDEVAASSPPTWRRRPTALVPPDPRPLPYGNGAAVELERMVNDVGLVGLADMQLNGGELANQSLTLRVDGTQITVISHGRVPLHTLPCPVRPTDPLRLRGGRRAASPSA